MGQRGDQALRRLPAVLGHEDPRAAGGGRPRRALLAGAGRRGARRPLRPVRRQDHLRGRCYQLRARRLAGARLSAQRRRVELPQHLRGQSGGSARGARSPRSRRHRAAGARHLVLLPGPHLQPLHLPRLPRRLPAQGDLQAARGRDRARGPEGVPRLPQVRGGLPLQEDHVPGQHAGVGKVHRLLPAGRGHRSRVGWGADGDPLHGGLHRPDPAAGAGRARGGRHLGRGSAEPALLPGARGQGGAAALPAARDPAERLLHPAALGAAALSGADVRARGRARHRALRPSRPRAALRAAALPP